MESSAEVDRGIRHCLMNRGQGNTRREEIGPHSGTRLRCETVLTNRSRQESGSRQNEVNRVGVERLCD